MTIANWNALSDPTWLDLPRISSFAANGWDIKGDASRGNTRYPVDKLGHSNNTKKDKTIKEITTRKDSKGVHTKSVDAYINYCKEKKIAVKNTIRMSLIKGRIIEIEENLNFIQKNDEEALLICFICAKYKPLSFMQGDHLQPKSSINKRLISFYEEENLLANIKNPNLKKLFIGATENEALTDDEITDDTTENEALTDDEIADDTTENAKLFLPNCFYGLGFHFSEDNIWPVCDSCNGLSKKADSDPFTFLKSQTHYGKSFFKNLPTINAQGILIRAGEVGKKNKTIATFAIEYFADKYKYYYNCKQLNDTIQSFINSSFTLGVERKDNELIDLIDDLNNYSIIKITDYVSARIKKTKTVNESVIKEPEKLLLKNKKDKKKK